MRLFLVFFACLLPACACAGEVWVTGDHALSGHAFATVSGVTVRLAGIEAPGAGEPLAQEARAALGALVAGRKLRIEALPDTPDRHGWQVAQVYADDGGWVQGKLLEAGWAMVSLAPGGDPQAVEKMLAQENAALAARRGIWGDPYFRVIAPQEADGFINRFKLVEGRVVSANSYHGNLYVNFFARWKGRFSLFVPHKRIDAFCLPMLLALPGKILRVRGWIDTHNAAPVIDVTDPQQLEILGGGK